MPRGLRTLHLSFKDSCLTHFGGMVLLQRFCNKLKLRWRIQKYVRILQRNADYLPSDLILAFLYAIMAGLRRINKTEILQYNGAFLSLLGLPRFPDQSTLRRFLKRMPPKAIRQLVFLHDQLRNQLFALPKPRSSLIFDLDSVVLTLYGKPQFARVGYNPKKRGRRSYHPILCFEAHLQEFWHGSLRPGNAVTTTGAGPFIKICLAKVPKTITRSRIRFRADSGLFNKTVVELLDQEGCGYAIVAKLYSTIKSHALRCRFQKLKNGWETGEFRYQPYRWKTSHRFIVVRRPIPEDPVEAKQLTLFKYKKYVYHVLVTNLKTHPWRVWRFYAQRANVEKDIRELLYDYPLGKIPTENWIANVAFFQILLFAYNLVHWFKRLCLPKEYLYTTLDTIRTDFLVLPARLIKQGSQNVLVLPQDYHYRYQFEKALKKIDKLKIPKNF
jgi:Transposase DDE domain group 1